MPPPPDLLQHFGYLVHDVARLSGHRFDRLARERLGLSRAQCKLLWALDLHGPQGMTQHELAEHLETTPMAVAALCARMETAGWISRHACAEDRRAKRVRLEPAARAPLAKAAKLSEQVLEEMLGDFAAADRRQLLAQLRQVRTRLVALREGEAAAAAR
jgi:DNA-binding MarR family transcriptional regulator